MTMTEQDQAVAVVDVKELTDVVDFALDFVVLGQAIAKDKKIDLSDLGSIIGAVPALISDGAQAYDNHEKIPAELSDLSGEEVAAMVAHVMARLSLEEGKAKAVLEAALKAAYANFVLVKAIVA